MQSNTALAWQDVPDAAPRSKSEIGPKGTYSGAHLVTDYFAVEHRTKEPIRWRIPRKSNRLETLRRELRNAQIRFGLVVQDGPAVERPNAGQRVYGPLPLPGARAKRPSPLRVLPLRADFRIPADQLYIPGLTWAFRAGFYRRKMDLTPLFTCTGLQCPGKGT